MLDEKSLQSFKIIDKKMQEFGFLKRGDAWIFSKKILADEFLLSVSINQGVIESGVFEVSTGDKFVLYDIQNHNGPFVAQMRAEYDKLVSDLISKCVEKEIFNSKQAKQIIKYVKSKYCDELEFLWEKFPDNAIFRNKNNKKWYCLICAVGKSKLFGKETYEKIEIVDLNLPWERVAEIVDGKKFFQGYHMNKKSWITIPLDNRVTIEEIYALIDESYQVSAKKK